MKVFGIIGAAFIAAMFACPAAAAVKQTVELAKVDITQVSAGYRASKVIGSTVLNDANESIGTIDDLLVSPDGKATYAVLSVGGFLGMGSKLVVVPYGPQLYQAQWGPWRPARTHFNRCRNGDRQSYRQSY